MPLPFSSFALPTLPTLSPWKTATPKSRIENSRPSSIKSTTSTNTGRTSSILAPVSDGFGLPSPSDPDPFGVLALQKAGLHIKEAGGHGRPSSNAFDYKPGPHSPVSISKRTSTASRRSADTKRSFFRTSTDVGRTGTNETNNRGSNRSSMSSVGTQTVDPTPMDVTEIVEELETVQEIVDRVDDRKAYRDRIRAEVTNISRRRSTGILAAPAMQDTTGTVAGNGRDTEELHEGRSDIPDHPVSGEKNVEHIDDFDSDGSYESDDETFAIVEEAPALQAVPRATRVTSIAMRAKVVSIRTPSVPTLPSRNPRRLKAENTLEADAVLERTTSDSMRRFEAPLTEDSDSDYGVDETSLYYAVEAIVQEECSWRETEDCNAEGTPTKTSLPHVQEEHVLDSRSITSQASGVHYRVAGRTWSTDTTAKNSDSDEHSIMKISNESSPIATDSDSIRWDHDRRSSVSTCPSSPPTPIDLALLNLIRAGKIHDGNLISTTAPDSTNVYGDDEKKELASKGKDGPLPIPQATL